MFFENFVCFFCIFLQNKAKTSKFLKNYIFLLFIALEILAFKFETLYTYPYIDNMELFMYCIRKRSKHKFVPRH